MSRLLLSDFAGTDVSKSGKIKVCVCVCVCVCLCVCKVCVCVELLHICVRVWVLCYLWECLWYTGVAAVYSVSGLSAEAHSRG